MIPSLWVDPGTLAFDVLRFAIERRQDVWLVGGAVRDRLLQRETHDLDFLVRADAAELARQLADHFKGKFYWLDEARDYGRALLPEEGGHRLLIVDVAPVRPSGLDDDLRARDFTVNAMAVRVRPEGSGDLIDPLGGLEDLRRGILRLASEQALSADPIRLLRAPRLASELGLRIAAETARSIRRDAHLLRLASAERVRDELWRMIGRPGCASAVRLLHYLDLLAVALPEAAALVGIEQGPPHHWDVFEHTLQAMAAVDRLLSLILSGGRPKDAVESLMWDFLSRHAGSLRAHLLVSVGHGRRRAGWLRWLALTHDWGKARTRQVEPDGRIRFLRHDRVGAQLVRDRLNALRFSRGEVARLSRMVRHHMRPLSLTRPGTQPSGRAVYRFFRDMEDAGVDLLLFALADSRATFGPDLSLEDWRAQVDQTVSLLTDWFDRPTESVRPVPLLDGRLLMERLGMAPGPELGRLLEAVREAQAVGEVRSREEALALARRLYRQRQSKQESDRET
ncbi:MAG: HD domain-containing protein [Anaerolineae bacterium]|nr:HD domain-containing protein [Anaerolineae bacterium]